MVGKLEPVALREIWGHEALDFTKWLYNNLDILGEHIGLRLTAIETEKSVGPFSVDILAEDASGRPVIIENQLERTDHDHLGKVLTYLSNLSAKISVWISTDPRPEHITAIDYLNEIVPQDTKFYLVKVQAYRIGNSDPAPLFSVEAGPSEEKSAGGEVKKEFAQRDSKRYNFFQQLLEKCNQKTRLFINVSPMGYQSWVCAGAGKMGLGWQMVITKKNSRAELFIAGQQAELNKQKFDHLHSQREQIEAAFEGPLSWDFNASRKQQYVRVNTDIGGLDDEERWEDIQDCLIDYIIKLEKAISPYIRSIP